MRKRLDFSDNQIKNKKKESWENILKKRMIRSWKISSTSWLAELDRPSENAEKVNGIICKKNLVRIPSRQVTFGVLLIVQGILNKLLQFIHFAEATSGTKQTKTTQNYLKKCSRLKKIFAAIYHHNRLK